jgi:hypothetical protein
LRAVRRKPIFPYLKSPAVERGDGVLFLHLSIRTELALTIVDNLRS